jgi:sec-independent protein translocase protein TatB
MDSFFGIGSLELLVILLLAGILLGPQRIRHVAKWLGKTTAQLQAIARTFARQLNAELDAADKGGDLRATMDELQDLRRQVAELRREVVSVAERPLNESANSVQEAQEALSVRPTTVNSIQPPRNGPTPDAPTPSQALPTLRHVPDDPDE